MSRYAIWDKKSPVITPVGEILSPEQWIERHPVAGLENITVLCAAGEINGAIFGTLGQMVSRYENEGVDFSSCATDEEKLALIEATDKAREEEDIKKSAEKEAEEAAKEADRVANEELTATSLASIAASMEYQNLLTLEDTEV